MGAPAAAVALRRAERHIVDLLRREGATRPDRAVPLPELRPVAQRRLRRLLNARVVHEAPGGYWLDEATYAGFESDRRAIALVLLGIVAASVLGVLLTRWF
jgi:hypothetical protein